jgi:hypothetical protein
MAMDVGKDVPERGRLNRPDLARAMAVRFRRCRGWCRTGRLAGLRPGRVDLIRGHNSGYKVTGLHGFAPEELLQKIFGEARSASP